MTGEIQSFFQTCAIKMKKVINRLVSGNPNVVILGLGNGFYCEKCEEAVNSVYHTCEKGTE
jgi:hypothetical protein